MRRDFTINSLYYNLKTELIEDYTGLGLEDLRNGRIRTPMAAYQTMIDDPLRILRALRFAVRYAMKIEPDILKAATDPNVKV